MYRCNDCGELFEEPIISYTSYEAYYGVSDQFDSKTLLRLELCCNCGSDDIENIEEEEE